MSGGSMGEAINGLLKCNVDGAVFAMENRYDVGVVLWLDNDSFVAMLSCFFEGAHEAKLVEALALRRRYRVSVGANMLSIWRT
ncbi:hypothetical protein M5689_002334 [Euphorbia peplus]|nr:hypothetical protein M5689_002334 [Euphorbia peplus]